MLKAEGRQLLSVGIAAAVLGFAVLSGASAAAQDQVKTGTFQGMERVRLAAPEFRPAGSDPQNATLLKVFNDTLWNDLSQAGIFDLVSKSFYPLAVPGTPREMDLGAWGNPPPNASMVAFGNLGVVDNNVAVQGWLFDVKNAASPQVLGKQYREQASESNARIIAHRFADEIIFQLGGGIRGIAETHIYYISTRSGSKEIWQMDYDGSNQTQLTHLGTCLSPRVSPDGTRIAFAVMGSDGFQLAMWSLDLARRVSFPRYAGLSQSPAWSPDGSKIAFSSSMPGDPEIYVADASGSNAKRITAFKGPDVSPTWNGKTGAQIAWVSGRTGLPQIYIMDADGGNPERVTDQGYAVSPSWSPNGQFLLFSWVRHYGEGVLGAQDIYIMDVASRQFIQLTHDGGRNDFPSWAPDGRHIVFQSSRSGGTQIWTMLVDGTQQHPLTSAGSNTQPNWGSK